MNCPSCSTALEQKRVRGRETEVDRCPKCEGVWFDDGEIASVIGANPFEGLTIDPKAPVKENLMCPRCRKALATFSYPGTMTVLEGCRNCSGLWLDVGELQEIAKAAKAGRERRMSCPSCRHEQPAAESCSQCGIIIKKFVERPARPSERIEPPASSRPRSNPQPGAAGGVKGSLLNFVNSSLSTLMEMMTNK